ncbi:RMD1 family protein [Chlamydiifrater phoenicopteri]|uniref:RMD1 family protein n=1 Tax=Chlamydiifrater phoenicopteri TaxID=2681469 RepID=UPI001BCCA8E4|nr:RMD1 family protein [Chlamydiifrater phoenicopteri]
MRCTAYCTASAYNLHVLFHLLKAHYTTTLSREYVLVISNENPDMIAVFFSYGTTVFWGWNEQDEIRLLQTLAPASQEVIKHPEIDKYNFDYGEKLLIRRDKLVLSDSSVNTKLAISFGLAQSVKLTIFEETIYKTIENSKRLPKDLATKGHIRMSRRTIGKRIGQLFLEKASVNLHSDILDEPDFFWEHPETQPIYRDVFLCLDIESRINVLNHRLTVLGDLLEILNDQLNHQHSSSLEWTIICLIMLELSVALLKDVFNVI